MPAAHHGEPDWTIERWDLAFIESSCLPFAQP
jgi:hypothetical protein